MKEKTWIEIDSGGLEHNISALKSQLRPEARFCAVVKANAYGHGTQDIVRIAAGQGIDCFAVDSFEEAVIAQKRAPSADIIILGYTPREKYEKVVEHGFIQTVYSIEAIEQLAAIAVQVRKQGRVNVKIETGTYRQGVMPEKLFAVLKTIKQYEREIEFFGMSSHFADAETPGSQMTEHQKTHFEAAVRQLRDTAILPHYLHMACSAAALLRKDVQYNLVRFGISLYGLWSSEETKNAQRVRQDAIDLKPILSFKTQIAQVKDLPKGATVGYGMRFMADRPMRIAVLPVGYYDGYRRSASGKAHVLVRGHKCKVIGTICMNMMMIDVSTMPNVETGEEVVLIGKSGMHQITAEDFAEWCGTINYEVPTMLGSHLPRLIV